MKVTLSEVARAAGVSRSTASRALSGSNLISEETSNAVSAAAASLGYRANRAAQTLRSKRSRLIGLVLNNLVNATFHVVAEEIQRRASDLGYQVVLSVVNGDIEREHEALKMYGDLGVDGVILVGSGSNLETIEALRESGCKIVHLIRSVAGSTSPVVLADDEVGATQAVQHLLDLGHRSIGFIGGPEVADSGRERLKGYISALDSAGVSFDRGVVRRGPLTADFGVDATRSLFSEESTRISALYVASQEAVAGVLPTLYELDVRVPDSLSIVCHEDARFLELWRPAVTVVDNDAAKLGRIAIDKVVSLIEENDTGESSTVRVRQNLMIRDSCQHL